MTQETAQKRPSPQQIDALVAEYAAAQSNAAAMGTAARIEADKASAIKVRLTEMVETWGERHTEKSKRLKGQHNSATTTTGTRMSIDAAAVTTFREFLDESKMPEISKRFFVEHTSYSLVEGPQEVLRTLDLGKRVLARMQALVAQCFQVKTNAPSLKIDIVEAEKPERAVA